MDSLNQAVNVARLFLDILPVVTVPDIEQNVDRALLSFPNDNFSDKEKERLVRKLQGLYTIPTGVSSALDDNPDHVEWLPERKAKPDTRWPFWDRYREHLLRDTQLPDLSLLSLDRETDNILGRLEDPDRAAPWDTRGMVVGNVQSGKTSNYTGLICKAADSGYKLIVVLGGHTNALRSQTQSRLDTGFLGYDTQIERIYTEGLSPKIGVGLISPSEGEKPFATSGTSSAENGDFSTGVYRRFPPVSGSDPLLMTIKKNMHSLQNLIKWIDALPENKSVPLLLIDDECDYASIDTSPEHEDPTTINRLIRQLLNRFDRSAYVAYTATPFANIFIDVESNEPTLGKDLFPQNFILNLPTSDNYIGPEKLFGVKNVEGEDDSEGLPLTREIPLHEDWIPTKHNKTFLPGDLPGSLKSAIKSFIIATAIRQLRDQADHNSMLIHVTRFVNVQNEVHKLVADELTDIQQRLRYGDENYPVKIIDQFESIWKEDFEPTAKTLLSEGADIFADPVTETWDQLEKILPQIVQKIQIRKFNGSSKDALDYNDRTGNPISVIAIGGDKLSRGLTLEGLTTCYFLRQSKMYDTLMQMGRWFGYRDGYLDLCRIFSDRTLLGFFTHITAASFELKRDFDYMEETGRTPMDFRLRVRTHPTTLMISGPTKLRHGTVIPMSYSGTLNQSIVFSKQAAPENRKSLKRFIDRIQKSGHKPDNRNEFIVWESIDGEEIADFVQTVCSYNKRSRRVHGDLLANYIKTQIGQKELTSWTVALVSNRNQITQGNSIEITGHNVGVSQRKDLTEQDPDNYIIKTLIDSKHESMDLSREERKTALDKSIKTWELNSQKKSTGSGQSVNKPKFPRGPEIRETRNPSKGLMLLYPIVHRYEDAQNFSVAFALSFPGSKTAKEISYMSPDWQIGEQAEMEFDI